MARNGFADVLFRELSCAIVQKIGNTASNEETVLF